MMATEADPPAESAKPESEPVGLVCPNCHCVLSRVYYTRRRKNGKIIRRRQCWHCGKKYTTVERSTS